MGELLARKVKLHLLTVIAVSCSFKAILSQVQSGPSDVTSLYAEQSELTCLLGNDGLPAWHDVTNPDEDAVEIFVEATKTTETTKYDNFNVSLGDGVYKLQIINTQIEDEGMYRCSTRSALDGKSAVVDVEVAPLDISITCVPSPNCPVPSEVVSSQVECTCKATGAYPSSLEMDWIGGLEPMSAKPTTISSIDGPNGSLDFTQDAAGITMSIAGNFTCTLTNYVIKEAEKTAKFEYVSPNCVLEVENSDVCSNGSATLVCICSDAIPNDITYIFFDGENNIIGVPSQSNRKESVSFPAGEETTFYCRGCNGFNFGEGSLGTETICKADGEGLSVVAIIFISLGGVAAVAAVGGGVYFVFFREPSNSSKGNNSVRDGESDIAPASNEETNSSAPLYGVVNKDKKKKSDDNTDGKGVNSTNSDQPEYAAVNKPLKTAEPKAAPRSSAPSAGGEPEKMELQYADIDHGNKGPSFEIHQPADAPTEYATVQSVIV